MFTTETLLNSDLPRVRVGIGRGTDRGFVERSVAAMDRYDITIYDDPGELTDDFISGNIEAAVRGDMSSSVLLPMVKEGLKLRRMERAAFMEPPGRKMFILAPVGIDEGWKDDQKYDIAKRSADLARKVGMGSKIGIMSGGRCEDVGRCQVVDKSIESARKIAKKLCDNGYDAYHCQILIENAVEEADVIVAPEGITGNIIFRSLHFIGGVKALGAPVVNTDRIFVDTSRAKVDYRDSLALTMMLAED